MEPSYRRLWATGELAARAAAAVDALRACRLCPRKCGVNRLADERGFCRTGRYARVAGFNAHFGEEAPLVGRHGSGTIFFSGCNLLCTFCQNYDISHLNAGDEVKPEELAAMMLRLARSGCHNINCVTPSHVVPQILEALALAIPEGLAVPLVYNSGGYDRVESLRLLDGIFDIYMPDFKFWDEEGGRRWCKAADYRDKAAAAIREMHRQVGDLRLGAEGLAVRGLLVRHLVMPEGGLDTRRIMTFLAREISRDTYVNVMNQYRPCGEACGDPVIGRRSGAKEYRAAVQAALDAGLRRIDAGAGCILRREA